MDADDEENAGAGVDDVDMDTDDKENDGADMDTNDEANDGADSTHRSSPSRRSRPRRSERVGVRRRAWFAAAKTPPHLKRRRRESSKKSTATLARLVREYARIAAARLELLAAGADVSALGRNGVR